jgi:hypothetical protein
MSESYDRWQGTGFPDAQPLDTSSLDGILSLMNLSGVRTWEQATRLMQIFGSVANWSHFRRHLTAVLESPNHLRDADNVMRRVEAEGLASGHDAARVKRIVAYCVANAGTCSDLGMAAVHYLSTEAPVDDERDRLKYRREVAGRYARHLDEEGAESVRESTALEHQLAVTRIMGQRNCTETEAKNLLGVV